MTTKQAAGKKRYDALLTALKLTLVGATCLVLVWLVGWFTRAEWSATLAAKAAVPLPATAPNRLIVLPTVQPLPTAHPTFAVRPKPVLDPLPTPLPGLSLPSASMNQYALPPLEPLPPSASSGNFTLQMPALKPIPPLPAASSSQSRPAARSRAS